MFLILIKKNLKKPEKAGVAQEIKYTFFFISFNNVFTAKFVWYYCYCYLMLWLLQFLN